MTGSQWQQRLDDLLAKYSRDKNVELFEELITETSIISTWQEFQEWISPFKQNGAFRGHCDATWSLITTLDRKIWQQRKVETESVVSETIGKLNPEENELSLLRDFRRAAHHHCQTTPRFRNGGLVSPHAVIWSTDKNARLDTLSLRGLVLRHEGRDC
jgi:hypothetical protein